MEDLDTFSISLKEYQGKKISLDNIPITLLDSYFTDLRKFIIGDSKEKDISIKISSGSLRTTIIGSIAFISALVSDTEAIEDGNISMSNPRAKAAINLQKYVKRNHAKIVIGEKKMKSPLMLSQETEILKPKELWVDVEDYAFGIIRNMGGVDPNVHLADENGNEIKISSTIEDLSGLKNNILYSKKLIHFKAKKNLATGEIRDRILISIEDLPKFDEVSFNEKVEKATIEWRGIDAKSFIDEIRGYNAEE